MGAANRSGEAVTFYNLPDTDVKIEYDKNLRTITLHNAEMADVAISGGVAVHQRAGAVCEVVLLRPGSVG